MSANEPTWRTFTDPSVIADNITQVSAVLERFALWPSPDAQKAIEARLRILTDAAIVIHCTRPEGLLGITTQGRFISSLQRGNATMLTREVTWWLNQNQIPLRMQ